MKAYPRTSVLNNENHKVYIEIEGKRYLMQQGFNSFDDAKEFSDRINSALSQHVQSELSELKNEISDLLSLVAQLIQGWNATEQEWSEWDREVYNKVVEMQFKVHKEELTEALNKVSQTESKTEKYIKEMSNVSHKQMQEPYMVKYDTPSELSQKIEQIEKEFTDKWIMRKSEEKNKLLTEVYVFAKAMKFMCNEILSKLKEK